MSSLWTIFLVIVAIYVLQRAYKITKALRALKQVPRLYCVVRPFSRLGIIFVPRGWWNPGMYLTWNDTLYTSRNTETVLVIPIFAGDASLYVCSPEATKDVLNEPNTWVKPKGSLGLNFMGANVVASNPPLWKKHRKIVAPAFDNQTFMNVWEVVTRAYHQMMTTPAWQSGGPHFFTSFNKVTTRVALIVIAGCGFNIQIDWENEQGKPIDLIDETVVTVSTHLIERTALPGWIFRNLPSLRPIKMAFENFERYLHSEVAAKQLELAKDIQLDGSISQANRNLFGRIVAASLGTGGSEGLTLSEITGNLFIFLFAGHETTAHSLVATLALLAIYPEEQDRVCKHIRSVVGDVEPTYDHYSALMPVLHCFYEAMRLYPPAWISIREPITDLVVSAPHLTPTGNTMIVPSGMFVAFDTIGACRNARHFPSPDSFIPMRWVTPGDPSAPPPAFYGYIPRVLFGTSDMYREEVCVCRSSVFLDTAVTGLEGRCET